ncbi:MAG TPA: hypothetical protein VF610_11315 [Segetibacter sp.]|jgi:hypothetical protein
MNLYFEFEGRRRRAEVTWPKNGGDIVVMLTDAEMVKKFPPDLLFEIVAGNKVNYIIESSGNRRLSELQQVLGKRLQELVNR